MFGAQFKDMEESLERTIWMVRAKAKIALRNLAYYIILITDPWVSPAAAFARYRFSAQIEVPSAWDPNRVYSGETIF